MNDKINYYVAVAVPYSVQYCIEILNIKFDRSIRMDNLKEFTDLCVSEAAKKAKFEMLPNECKVISWQIIKD